MTDTQAILLIAVAAVALLVVLAQRKVTTIYPPNVGLLYRNGRFERELAPGRHSFFDPLQRTRIVQLSTAELPTVLGEFTVMTKDQFSFRVGLSPVLQVVDARAFVESQAGVAPAQFDRFVPSAPQHAALHPLTASAAIEVATTCTLREFLADAQLILDGVRQRIATALPGAEIKRVLLTSVTLPPETRKMLTEVERSKLDAEAALERARGEHAALRVLANAARLVKDNPALGSLRFLQTLQQTPGPKTIVVGSGAVPLTGDLTGSAA